MQISGTGPVQRASNAGGNGGGIVIPAWPRPTAETWRVAKQAPSGPPRPVMVGGQKAWFHDEGHSYGTFHTFDNLRLGDDRGRKVHVLVPRGFAAGGRYPVAYVLDGHTTFFPGGPGGKSWMVAETLSTLMQQGKIKPFIVVAIHPLRREVEYLTGTREPGGHYRIEQFTRYVADVLKPFIDANYRTDPRREGTSIIGSSHGGFAAFYMGTRRPDRFGNVGAQSPSFWRGLDTPQGNGGALAKAPLYTGAQLGNRAQRPKMWIDWGMYRSDGPHNEIIEERAARRGREMAELLASQHGYRLGQDLYAYEDAVAGHEEDAWRDRFQGVAQAFYGV